MADPVTTAAEAMDQASRFAEELAIVGVESPSRHEHLRTLARTALGSLRQHRDDIARVLHDVDCPDGTSCDATPTVLGRYYRQADALLAWLGPREASR